MPFVRHLDPKFVSALNQLHEDQKSWWHTLANDPGVFLAVRNNAINAYANGGSIGRILWNGKSPQLFVNHAYLVFPARLKTSRYVDLVAQVNPPTPIVISDPKGFVEHLKAIKEVVQTYFGPERQGENEIAVRLKQVIDIEAAFDTATEDDDSEFEGDDLRHGRVDLVAVSENGHIVFTEAKVFKNRELRSSRTPPVCGQLILYHEWIKDHESNIRAAYTELASVYQNLHGKFFRGRIHPVGAKLTVDSVPRLLVYGFDSSQQKEEPELKQPILDGIGDAIPGFTKNLIRFVGSPRSVTSAKLL